ncbi:hypothetical protein [Burkholderia ubonensis]|nr:hypothetical protein [Burkholderia ubonensis]
MIGLAELEALHPRLQFIVIQAAHGGYVGRFKRDVFPGRYPVQKDPGEA